MKIRKLIYCVSIMLLLLTACTTSKNQDYTKLLQGTWINTMVNNQNILTDDTFVMEFTPNNTQMYAIGFQLDETNKSWIENSTYNYNIQKNSISITGTDALENSMQMEFKIISLNENNMTFSVSKFSVNGQEVPDDKIYTFDKVSTDYKDKFVGIWYGKNTSDDSNNNYNYWEYFKDGSFDYYYQDQNNNWIKKANNDGHYYLYGQLMVSNYSNDLLTDITGKTFECWNFTLDNDKMKWTSLRDNNQVITFEMEKVSSLPEIIQ